MKRILPVVTVLLLPTVLIAQEGKLRGQIIDSTTREPLIGVNVLLEGTTNGAATDAKGDYIILGIPPGVYSIKASYIGYQPVSFTNIRVSPNMTTTRDFALDETTIELESLEITAERPLVQRNTTNTVRMTTQDDLQNLPIRGLQSIMALNAGAVQQDGVLYVRGGRAGEVAFFVDGATATNPWSIEGVYNAENVTVIQEALEEVQMQSGGYTAEYGGSNSAIVQSTLRTGGNSLQASLDYQTDDFAQAGSTFLGTHSYGFRNAVATLSGPLFPRMRFFVAAQHHYMRNRTPSFIEPFRFELVDDGLEGREAGEPLPQPLAYLQNHLPDNRMRSNTIQGTVNLKASTRFRVKLSGSHTWSNANVGHDNFAQSLINHYWERELEEVRRNSLLSLRATHLLSSKTFYEARISWSERDWKIWDPEFGDDWRLYADREAFRDRGYDVSGWRGRFTGPPDISTIFNFRMSPPGAPVNFYTRNDQTNVGGAIDLTSQISKNWELKAGGKLDTWRMRRYRMANIRSAMEFLFHSDGSSPKVFESDAERDILLTQNGFVTRFGYDGLGNRIDGGANGPRNPSFAAGYIQNKLEYKDLIVNLGARFERIDIDALQPAQFTELEYDRKLDHIHEDQLTTTSPQSYVLPRVSFSFPVTDRTVLYTLYGKYVQMPSLFNVLLRSTPFIISESFHPNRGGLGFTTGFTAKPEETTQYEIGIRHALTDRFAITSTVFYKSLENQLRLGVLDSDGEVYSSGSDALFRGLVNSDIGTVTGMELTLELRRTKRLSARAQLTISSAKGTGSNLFSNRRGLGGEAGAFNNKMITNLDHNQPYHGSIVLDYRFGDREKSAVTRGLGLHLLFNFTSGHSYTKIANPNSLGSITPWTTALLTAITGIRAPQEEINTSLTPWNYTLDANLSKLISLRHANLQLYVNILNVLNTKNIINFYTNTASATDDGWLANELSRGYLQIPLYEEFYRAINLDNRWSYQEATGRDLFGTPRQIRFGIRVEVK